VNDKAQKAGARFVLAEDELHALAAHALKRAFPRNAIIVNEGDRTDTLYVILEGRVKVYTGDADGREVVLSTHGPGEYFGEMVLDEGPRSASVMTLEPSRFLVVSKADLKDFLLRNPPFAVHLIEKLIDRVRQLTQNVKSLALMDVYGRVARLLLELAREDHGKLVVGEKLTQQDIASRVGASREMISRILKDLSAWGYITVEKKLITVNKTPPARW
jgi:CRP/FNR family cyclic AMP-dependent transcriptional regulator